MGKKDSIDGATSARKKKIYIVGDQQARGLAAKLYEDRKKKDDYSYDVSGIVKPGQKAVKY